jgi:hypothetical protein
LRDFKISFYVNSNIDKLSEKQKRIDYFIIMGVVVRRDDGHRTMIKKNDDSGWSSDDVVLWLAMRQN